MSGVNVCVGLLARDVDMSTQDSQGGRETSPLPLRAPPLSGITLTSLQTKSCKVFKDYIIITIPSTWVF